MKPVQIAKRLVQDLAPLRFSPPVTHVYNPLIYAAAPYATYVERFGAAPKDIVLVGMNPGPYGMAQTGIPFGEIKAVRDWMGIEAPVGKPKHEHPARPVEGFACRRSEVSGARLWGWAQSHFGTADNFFASFFVANYCPLVFMEESGKNRTPDKLPRDERTALYSICDAALRALIEYMTPRMVIGVGAFAEARAKVALAGLDVQIGHILHPSPASPLANRGWGAQATEELRAYGVL